jgi:hypothetical protein
MKIEIKHRCSGIVLYAGEHDSLRQAVEDANLVGANLVGANLVGANLEGANLEGANLDEANLEGANLVGASLVGANLEGANLNRANLNRASLVGANLDEANLVGASLVGASLVRANLNRANLNEANLVGANLVGANLDAIREDFRLVLDAAPNEVDGLRLALVEGRIDGSTYSGECACLVGTIANLRHCTYCELPGLTPDGSRPAERWFLAIYEGDTPETSQPAKIAIGWIDEWIADRAAVVATTQA